MTFATDVCSLLSASCRLINHGHYPLWASEASKKLGGGVVLIRQSKITWQIGLREFGFEADLWEKLHRLHLPGLFFVILQFVWRVLKMVVLQKKKNKSVNLQKHLNLVTNCYCSAFVKFSDPSKICGGRLSPYSGFSWSILHIARQHTWCQFKWGTKVRTRDHIYVLHQGLRALGSMV